MILGYSSIMWPNNTTTAFYIEITISVFIAVLLNHQIRQFLFWAFVKIRPDTTLQAFNLDKLVAYLLSAKNIRFMIYSIYVVLLFTMNFSVFENQITSENEIKDQAILQSFVTFIAFDRALILLKDLQFKPSDLLRLIVRGFLNEMESTKKEMDKHTEQVKHPDKENGQ